MPPNDSAPAEHGSLLALLYTSRMASPDGAEVERICARSRANNVRDGITGLLVFDGQAFCQYVEGPPDAVARLRTRIERDPRHVDIRVLRFGRAGPARRFPSWRLGYAFAADADAITRIETGGGDEALESFARWLRDIGATAAVVDE